MIVPQGREGAGAPVPAQLGLGLGDAPSVLAAERALPGGGPGVINVGAIFLEPTVLQHAWGPEILDRFPDAERFEVPSHWNIPGLHGNAGAVRDWVRTKRTTLVLGVKKGLTIRPNGRSADFIAPSHANGYAMACAYYYVPRRKGFANPITTFVNIDQIGRAIERRAAKQGPKPEPNRVDPDRWVYDVGENGDCSVDALIAGNVRDLVALFRRLPNAKGSFATTFVNRDLLAYDPQGKTRVRFRLMPARIARVVDVRTSPIPARIAAIDDFVAAGYEVHLNLSPVILSDGWLADDGELFQQIAAAHSPRAKAQLAAEVIFLTHNERWHEVNLGWHPKAEALLWRPELQETKVSGTGGENVRYRSGMKGRRVKELTELLRKKLPYCRVRYAF